MARHRAAADPPPQRLILDSGAVVALSRVEARARAYLARALEVGARIEVPVVVGAETVRSSPRDATIHRLLAYATVPPLDESEGPSRRAAARAGELRGDRGRPSSWLKRSSVAAAACSPVTSGT